jgi:hypothetical protein
MSTSKHQSEKINIITATNKRAKAEERKKQAKENPKDIK